MSDLHKVPRLLEFTDSIWTFRDLNRVAIIGAQHIMESTLGLFRVLKMNGLCPAHTFLLGKCYSTSRSVFKNFRDEGFNVCKNSFFFDSHIDYDVSYKKNIVLFLKESLKKAGFESD